jgi:hypothetical protein
MWKEKMASRNNMERFVLTLEYSYGKNKGFYE